MFWQRWPWPIMLDGNEHEGHILRPSHLNMAVCFRKLGHAVSQEITQLVAGDDKHRQVDLALKQFLPQVNQVNRQHVATAGDLDLDADADMTGPAVYGLLLDPIDATALLLIPSAGGAELFVNECPEDFAAVRVLALFDEKLELSYDSSNLV